MSRSIGKLVAALLAVAPLAAAPLVAACGSSKVAAPAVSASSGTSATSATAVTPGGPVAPVAPPSTPGASATQAPPPRPVVPPAKVKLFVKATPQLRRQHTQIFWGRRLLGETPLTVERQQSSGPMDLVLRSEGFLPVHVRAYTDKNDVVVVQLTKVEDRMTLFGARKELPPEDAPAIDQPQSGVGGGMVTPTGEPPSTSPTSNSLPSVAPTSEQRRR